MSNQYNLFSTSGTVFNSPFTPLQGTRQQAQSKPQPSQQQTNWFNQKDQLLFNRQSDDLYMNSTHSSISSISRDSTFSQPPLGSFSSSSSSFSVDNLSNATSRRPSYVPEYYPKLDYFQQQLPANRRTHSFSFNEPNYSFGPRQSVDGFPFEQQQVPTPLRQHRSSAPQQLQHSQPVQQPGSVSSSPIHENVATPMIPKVPKAQAQAQAQAQARAKSDSPESQFVLLSDGLMLDNATNTIVTSPELHEKFKRCANYFGDFDASLKVVDQMNSLLSNENGDKALQERTNRLLNFLLTQNQDLQASGHLASKNYSLILNKNGRLDIISFPKKSNLRPSPGDVIIIEGDRGKDLVMVLQPLIKFRFALFFNYLKKKLHLKSLEFGNSSGSRRQQRQRHQNKQNRSIINEDENFITLPNKQILRFAKPRELSQLVTKYNDEMVALKICLNCASSLNLDLIIKNVEFQFDKKKLIIYYYCLQRLDFRGLIKELFKIYKTRIWLCAVLPLENSFKPLLDYELDTHGLSSHPGDKSYRSQSHAVQDTLPETDQIYDMTEIKDPINFHAKIFGSLVEMFRFELSNLGLFKERYWFLEES